MAKQVIIRIDRNQAELMGRIYLLIFSVALFIGLGLLPLFLVPAPKETFK